MLPTPSPSGSPPISTTYPANQLPPPDSPTILYHNTHLPGKISAKHTKHLHEAHTHNNIHLSLSTTFFLTSSGFSRLNFKWVNGLFSCYAPHYNQKEYTCPLRHTNHPRDPTSFTALCHSSKVTHLRKLINNTWSSTTRPTVDKWYHSATSGEKRNYIRTHIPTSLSHALRTHPANISYSSHKSQLLHELKARTTPLSTVPHTLSQWFQDNPIPNLDSLIPTSERIPWNIPLSEFGTSSTQPIKLSYPNFNLIPQQSTHQQKIIFQPSPVPKPKPKKHNLIHLTYATATTHHFTNTFNIIPPPHASTLRHQSPEPKH